MAHAKHMGIHGNRRFAKCDVEHHVGGLAAHSGQGFKGLAGARYLATVPHDELLAGRQQMPGLRAEKADSANVAFQALLAERDQRRGCVGDRKEPSRCLVDAHIGRLGRQHNGREQLEHARIFQFAHR